MFERFTDRSRRVLVYAQDEARDLGHDFIGTEHLLLGLVREGDGIAAKTLRAVGVTEIAIREKIEALVGRGDSSPGSPPFTERAKKTLELSLREALQLGHSYIGTEHLLLGLVRKGDGVAVQILRDLNIEQTQIRESVMEMMSHQSGRDVIGSPGEVHIDSAILRGVVRTVGEHLRPDLDAVDLENRVASIAHDLYNQLVERWGEAEQ
jgi:ATP-dependent Clp protease ATP-binding subunit ClpC